MLTILLLAVGAVMVLVLVLLAVVVIGMRQEPSDRRTEQASAKPHGRVGPTHARGVCPQAGSEP